MTKQLLPGLAVAAVAALLLVGCSAAPSEGNSNSAKPYGDCEVSGNLRQQAGDDELGQADAEASDGEGQQSWLHE